MIEQQAFIHQRRAITQWPSLSSNPCRIIPFIKNKSTDKLRYSGDSSFSIFQQATPESEMSFGNYSPHCH